MPGINTRLTIIIIATTATIIIITIMFDSDNDPDGIETRPVDMFEAGGEEGSGFHVFNAAPDQYHRAEVLQRTGAIDISCTLEKVVHGIMSAESDRYATLMVLQWLFQPRGSRRISEATIELLFDPGPGSGDVEVEQLSFHGTYSFMQTTQSETIAKGGEAAIGAEQFASLSLMGKWEKTVARTTSDAITLSGGKRVINNKPPNRVATWTLSENETLSTGIPASLKVAVLVSTEDRQNFFCRPTLTCKTDAKTTFESIFKKIPKDDPIILQPNPDIKGTRPNKNVTYGNGELQGVGMDQLANVTYRVILPNAGGEKS